MCAINLFLCEFEFAAGKAIDQLLDSPWAQPKKNGEVALFTTRESVVEYLDV